MSPISCLNAIKNRYPSLTAVEKRVADYIQHNRERICSMSVSEFSHKADVTKSAIVRCCKSLGFAGYTELKMSLAI